MDRRQYLSLSGVFFAGLAGCSEESAIEDPQETPGAADDPTPGDADSSTPTEPSGEPRVQFGDRKLNKDSSSYSTEVYAEVIVENTGDATAGEVTVDVEWYDTNGNYLDDSTGRLPSLEAGEVWIAQVSAYTTEPEEIDSFEISGEFENSQPVAPEGMQVAESQLDVGEYSSKITGVAENNRDDEFGYIEVHGKLYDGQGRVIGGGSANESSIPAGRDWAFGIRLSGRAEARAEDATEHIAFLDATLS